MVRVSPIPAQYPGICHGFDNLGSWLLASCEFPLPQASDICFLPMSHELPDPHPDFLEEVFSWKEITTEWHLFNQAEDGTGV